jgi:hypothetical protein
MSKRKSTKKDVHFFNIFLIYSRLNIVKDDDRKMFVIMDIILLNKEQFLTENNTDIPCTIQQVNLIFPFKGLVLWVFLISHLQLLMQSVPITTKVVSSNPADGEMYLIQHYVIKFVSDLRQVDGFLLVFRFPAPINCTPWYNWNIVESDVKHYKPMLSKWTSFQVDTMIHYVYRYFVMCSSNSMR